ncbi:MAG: SDR family oxidoreductase [Casimicrobiaceae bacterium]|nr:SDR family oxidoreductase [Casimicrobiaceae bacterium]MCX8097797.1 SDR family oxidoreductase [Casimicrobiaceae bacterium]MDW8312647.1 SDR family oxidoreductase [Burkholderiales bacterium]
MSSEPSSAPGTALVTGTSSGIGRAVALELIRGGWRVIGADRAAPTISAEGFSAVELDLLNTHELAAWTCREGHDIDGLVHAAGTLTAAPLGQLDHEAGERMWRLHVAAAAVLADALIPRMAARRFGRVVLIGSRIADGMPGRSQYAATKAALVALARSWAAEVAAQGVTVNVIAPAATRTAMLGDPARATSAPRIPPIGRLIEPEEVASLVGYLFSPSAAAITGQSIAICGGASLSR